MAPLDLSLDNLSLQFLEHGPIRQIADIEFDLALDRLERERDIRLTSAEVQETHDTVVVRALIEVLDGRQSLIKRGTDYFFTPSAQRELCAAMERGIIACAPAPRELAGMGCERRCNPLLSVLPLTPVFRSMASKIHRFLFP